MKWKSDIYTFFTYTLYMAFLLCHVLCLVVQILFVWNTVATFCLYLFDEVFEKILQIQNQIIFNTVK